MEYSENPLVSIIIPTFNRSNKIIETLNTIINQTYKNLEIIVIDDGSKDDTYNKINEFILINSLENKMTYYYQINSGVSSARNNGINRARGEYIVFFDSDDFMHNERIEKQLNNMLENDSDLSCCGFGNISDGSTFIPPTDKENMLIKFLRKKNNLRIGTQAWMMKKSILNSINGYDEKIKHYEDEDIVFRYLITGAKVSFLMEALSLYDDTYDKEKLTGIRKTYNDEMIDGVLRYYTNIFNYILENKIFIVRRLFVLQMINTASFCVELISIEKKHQLSKFKHNLYSNIDTKTNKTVHLFAIISIEFLIVAKLIRKNIRSLKKRVFRYLCKNIHSNNHNIYNNMKY